MIASSSGVNPSADRVMVYLLTISENKPGPRALSTKTLGDRSAFGRRAVRPPELTAVAAQAVEPLLPLERLRRLRAAELRGVPGVVRGGGVPLDVLVLVKGGPDLRGVERPRLAEVERLPGRSFRPGEERHLRDLEIVGHLERDPRRRPLVELGRGALAQLDGRRVLVHLGELALEPLGELAEALGVRTGRRRCSAAWALASTRSRRGSTSAMLRRRAIRSARPARSGQAARNASNRSSAACAWPPCAWRSASPSIPRAARSRRRGVALSRGASSASEPASRISSRGSPPLDARCTAAESSTIFCALSTSARAPGFSWKKAVRFAP